MTSTHPERPVPLGITGATGRLGGRIARLLADAGVEQRLLVRDPARAPELDGAAPREMSYGDAARAEAACNGLDVVLMVSGAESAERLRQHKTFVDAFYMDKNEITNEQYARYVQTAGKPAPWYWPGGKVPKGDERKPVHDVTWFEAEAYCKAAGKRLPTEAEWERAVRGGLDRKKFAWGDNAPGLGGNDPDAAPGTQAERTKPLRTSRGFLAQRSATMPDSGAPASDASPQSRKTRPTCCTVTRC